MAVTGEGVEGDVAGNADFRRGGFHRLDDAGDEALRIHSFLAALVFLGGVNVGEDGDGGDAELAGADGGLGGFIDVEPVDAGHGFDGDARLLAVMDDHAPDEIIRARLGFSDEPAGPVMLAQPAHAGGRVSAGDQGLGHGRRSFDWEHVAIAGRNVTRGR